MICDMKTECLLQILQKGPEQISLEVAEQLETKEIYLATGYTDMRKFMDGLQIKQKSAI